MNVQRRIRMFPICCSFLLFVLATIAPAGASAQEEIRIGGTGGMLAAMRMLASEYRQDHPGIKITVLPSLGSSGGIRAVLAGALDVGVSSRQVNEKERGALALPMGRTPFVFAMRTPAPISGLTMKQIEDLYAGRTLHWPNGREARLVLRPAAEYDTLLLRSMSPEMERTVTDALSREGMLIAVTDQDNAHAIMTVPGTIGTITAAQILCEGLPFTILSLDGVAPTEEALASGAYPYSKTYYLVRMPDPRPAVRRFLAFIETARGRAALSRCGYQAVP